MWQAQSQLSRQARDSMAVFNSLAGNEFIEIEDYELISECDFYVKLGYVLLFVVDISSCGDHECL